MTTRRRRQPLKIAGPESSPPLPMEELRASVKGAKLALKGVSYEHTEPPLGPIEAALAKTLFEYLTPDPAQRTYDNVRIIAAYLHFSFGSASENEWERVSATFDWELINRISESQMLAAYALAMMYADSVGDTPPDTKGLAAALSIDILAKAVSLHEASAVRNEKIEGAQARVQRDPKSAAMLLIQTEYLRWKEGHHRFRSNAKFASEMVRRYPIIENARSIENNCPRWERARRKTTSS